MESSGGGGRRAWLLAADFKPMTGGVAEYLHRVWDELARQHAVTVYSAVPHEGVEWAHRYALRPVRAIPDRRLGERWGDGIPLIRRAHSLRHERLLRGAFARVIDEVAGEVRPGNSVYVGNWNARTHWWCDALRRAGIPYRIYAYGLELVEPLSPRLARWRQADFRGAAEVLANSRATAALVRQRAGQNVAVRVNTPGVSDPPDASSIAVRAAELRASLRLGEGPVLVTVGRLVRRKGVDQVIRSVADLRAEFPGVRYLVAGDGPEMAVLRGEVERLELQAAVHLLGRVDDVTKWALYDLCDLFVMPNRLLGGVDWEGFGIVFLEAARLGKPSIGGDNGGVPDAIENGSTGLLVDPEVEGELTAALLRLLSDAALRRRLGEAARVRAEREFSWSAVAEAHGLR